MKWSLFEDDEEINNGKSLPIFKKGMKIVELTIQLIDLTS